MIFRDAENYEIAKSNPRIEQTILDVWHFAKKIAPLQSQKDIDDILQNLTIFICDNKRKYHIVEDGVLHEMELCDAAHMFWTDIDSKSLSFNYCLAMFEKSNPQLIAHETLHAFSSQKCKNENGAVIKTGIHQAFFNDELNFISEKGIDLNEAVTDALASRFVGNIGPNLTGAGYGAQLIIADLLIGENLQDNQFIQDVYFGNSQAFASDFNRTVKSSEVNFDMYIEGFRVLGQEEDCKKADLLLQAAVEYNLRKAQTPEEIDRVYLFQKKVIDFYKNGRLGTGFIEDQDIKRLEKLSIFANKMQLQCKRSLASQEENKKNDNIGLIASSRKTKGY